MKLLIVNVKCQMSINAAVFLAFAAGDSGCWLLQPLLPALWALGLLDLSRVEVAAGALAGTLVLRAPYT